MTTNVQCNLHAPTSSSGRWYFSTSTRSRGQKRSFLMCRSSPWRVKKSLEYLPALHTRRGITPSSSMNRAMWSSSLPDRQHEGQWNDHAGSITSSRLMIGLCCDPHPHSSSLCKDRQQELVRGHAA